MTKTHALILSLVLALPACGGKDETSAGGGTAPEGQAPAAGAPETPVPPAGNPRRGEESVETAKAKGEALAKEAIEAFDQIVAEVAKALEAKPEQEEAMPKLREIHEAWLPRMAAFAARRRELVDAPARGGFFGYMGEHRGKAMFRKDNALGEYFKHYRMVKPGPQVIEFLEKSLVSLMETAHNG